MLRNIICICLLLLSTLANGQGEISPDTSTRPKLPGRYRIFSDPNGNFFRMGSSGRKEVMPRIADVQVRVQWLSLSQARALTKAPDGPVYVHSNGGGMFVADPNDVNTPDNTGTVIVTASGLRLKLAPNEVITPQRFGAIVNDNNGDSRAIQQALDAASSVIGGLQKAGRTVVFPGGRYILDSIVNLTNTRLPGTLSRDGIVLAGDGTNRTVFVGRTGAGRAAIETTGAQWLTVKDLSITTDGTTRSSTIGIYAGIGSILPQTQNQIFQNVSILMHSDPKANAGKGTVAYYNFGAEENTHNSVYYSANRAAVLTAYADSPLTYRYSKVAQLASHSLGVTTFSGECFLEALGAVQPALEVADVNSVHSDNLYISGTLLPGLNPTQFQAIRVRGGATNCHFRGTIEGFSGAMQVFGRLTNSDILFDYGHTNVAGKPVFLLEQGEGTVEKCNISVKLNADLTRPMWAETTTSTNQITSCYVRDCRVNTNALMTNALLPSKVVWHPSSGGVDIRAANHSMRYESGRQIAPVSKQTIRGPSSTSLTTLVATIALPTAIAATSAMSMQLYIKGTAGHNVYVSASPTSLSWEGVIPIVCSINGVPTVGTPVSTNIAYVAANPLGNTLSAIGVSTSVVGKSVLVFLTPATSGANNEAVTFVGEITLHWMGHSCAAPTLILP